MSSTLTRRDFLGMAPLIGAATREALGQTSPTPAFPEAARKDLAALSRALGGGRDFALVRWFGAAPGDVNDGWHLGVLNRSSNPVHAFLFGRAAGPDRSGKLPFRGEAREISGRSHVLNMPSSELGTNIPNLWLKQPGTALVGYLGANRDLSLSELEQVTKEPFDPLNAEIWITRRNAQPKPTGDLQEFRWKTPGLGQRVLEVNTNVVDGKRRAFILYNTDLAMVRVKGGGRLSKRSPLGPYVLRTFTAQELASPNTFSKELRDIGLWKQTAQHIRRHQAAAAGFVLEKQMLERGADGKWFAREQHFGSLRMVREDGRLRIADYFVGG